MTMKTEKTGFEPLLITKNDTHIENSTKSAKLTAAKLNDSLEVALDFIGQDLTDNQLKQLLQGGFKFAMELVSKDFQFPKADDAFNLKSMGKDPEPAKLALRSTRAWFSGYIFDVKNKEVFLTDAGKEKIIQSACVYTENEKQNEVFALAKRMCKEINDALTRGLVSARDQTPIKSGLQIVEYGKGQYIPNTSIIRNINDRGKVQSSW